MAELEIVATDPGDFIYVASLPDESPLYIFLPGSEFVLLATGVTIQRTDANLYLRQELIAASRAVEISRIPIEQFFDYELQAGRRLVEIGSSDADLQFVESLQAAARIVEIGEVDATLRFGTRLFTTATRAVQILRSPADGYLLDTSVFPSLRPTRRRFTAASHALRLSSAQDGHRVRTLQGSKASDCQMSLTYENISDIAAAEILSIYDRHDIIKPVELPPEVFAGSSGTLQTQQDLSASDLDWYFASPPTLRSVIGGVSTVELNLRGRRKSTASTSLLYFPVSAGLVIPADSSSTSGEAPKCAPFGNDDGGGGGPVFPIIPDPIFIYDPGPGWFNVTFSFSVTNWSIRNGPGSAGTTGAGPDTYQFTKVRGPFAVRNGEDRTAFDGIMNDCVFWFGGVTDGEIPASQLLRNGVADVTYAVASVIGVGNPAPFPGALAVYRVNRGGIGSIDFGIQGLCDPDPWVFTGLCYQFWSNGNQESPANTPTSSPAFSTLLSVEPYIGA